jgi:predicted nucleic acid-binding protein
VAFTALFDADVLHPAGQRDLLIRLAQVGLFRGRWTVRILDEMESSVIARHPEHAGKLTRTRDLMCAAVPDCLVIGYEDLIEALTLPDPDDRHVLAAAIRCGAQVIVTNNQRDFPQDVLDEYAIEAQTADEFLAYLVDLRPAIVAATLQRQADSLRDPPLSLEDLLSVLERSGLTRTVSQLRIHLQP